jgi:F0F1-type ATP synthase membrane subunit c/vacuolar-type H+-ATPase subunit K
VGVLSLPSCLPSASATEWPALNWQRTFVPFLITVGLVEAAFFINVAFMALFVFATPGK